MHHAYTTFYLRACYILKQLFGRIKEVSLALLKDLNKSYCIERDDSGTPSRPAIKMENCSTTFEHMDYPL